jgi:two-component system, cell cycle sensor histidine kinase and response regulator CckA
LYSKPGKGSAFHVFLPKAPETREETAEEQGNASGGTERILFVDDEWAVAGTAQRLLERLGYQGRP